MHSCEEYATRFYAVFPPAVALNLLLPGVVRPGFIAINTALISFGLWCYAARVRPERATAPQWIGVWIAIEVFNGIAHPVWAIRAQGYVPGLASAPLLLIVALALLWRLRPEATSV